MRTVSEGTALMRIRTQRLCGSDLRTIFRLCPKAEPVI